MHCISICDDCNRLYGSGKEAGVESQADCLQFLMRTVKQLRMAYFIRQKLALEKMKQRYCLTPSSLSLHSSVPPPPPSHNAGCLASGCG